MSWIVLQSTLLLFFPSAQWFALSKNNNNKVKRHRRTFCHLKNILNIYKKTYFTYETQNQVVQHFLFVILILQMKTFSHFVPKNEERGKNGKHVVNKLKCVYNKYINN